MTGQIRWAVYGGVAVVVGIGLLFAARRKRVEGVTRVRIPG
jgi:LPXTG-motif cell wall-anchored protein